MSFDQEPQTGKGNLENKSKRTFPSTIDLRIDTARVTALRGPEASGSTSFNLLEEERDGQRLRLDMINKRVLSAGGKIGYIIRFIGGSVDGGDAYNEDIVVNTNDLTEAEQVLRVIEKEWKNSMKKSKDTPPTLSELVFVAREKADSINKKVDARENID